MSELCKLCGKIKSWHFQTVGGHQRVQWLACPIYNENVGCRIGWHISNRFTPETKVISETETERQRAEKVAEAIIYAIKTDPYFRSESINHITDALLKFKEGE